MLRILLAVPVLAITPLILAEAAGPTPAEERAALDRIYREALVNGKAYDELTDLVGKYPGRLAGSDALTGAVQWGFDTMNALGFENVHRLPCRVPHWVRGAPESVELTEADGSAVPLTAVALGGSSATPEDGLSAEVIEVQGLAEARSLGAEAIKGKIVFFDRPMDPASLVPGKAYGQAGDQRIHGPGVASRYGAVGVLTRSLTQSVDDVPHTGVTQFTAEEKPLPCAALSMVAADRLSAALKANPHAKVRMAIHAQTLPDVPSADVIGELRGSDHPDQVLLVGGHLDSWDIAPGAHDDGTGVVQSLEAIRIFKALGLRPKHTLRCVLFVNEENGLRGATAYREYAATAPEHHLFAIETDNGGFDPKGFQISNRNHDAAGKAARWSELFAGYGIRDIAEGGAGADVIPLAALGVTVAQLTPDSQRYFDIHHTRIDSIDKVNKRELHLGAAALASLLWLVDQEGI